MSMIFIPDEQLFIEPYRPSIAESLQDLGIISYKSFEYWSAHFASILQCLHNHVNLEKSPRNLANFPYWSLKDLRASNPFSYIETIEKYLKNWGFQYFLINLLNSQVGIKLSSTLRQAIASINNRFDLETYRFFRFESAGIDSALSRVAYLSDQKKFRNVPTERKHVAFNSDLALLYSSAREPCGELMIAFGEVEGNYGHRLLKAGFWDDKHPDLDFGIGVVKGKDKRKALKDYIQLQVDPQITLNYVPHSTGFKAVILIRQEHDMVQDYWDAIQLLKEIYYRGADYRVLNNISEELKQICYMLVVGFETPILDLLQQFKINSDYDNFIDPYDYRKKLIIRPDV